jgi:hypothetical protein
MILTASGARAQETLDTLLDRGFVAHWLVCGPFPTDVTGGIAAALGRGDAPLGNTDFMEPLGGIERMRPRHLLEVATPTGKAMWMRAGATTPSLDLAPFFPDAAEGVAYAAFFAESAIERPAYLRMHTVLGARVWLNGRLLRDVRDAPLATVGVERMLVTFGTGLNLLVMEVPGARFETIAPAIDVPLRTLRAQVFRNRDLLEGASGFEVALTVQPAAQLGSVAYMPRLEHTGAFSGPASSPRQVAALTLFNPTGTPTPPVRVRAEVRGAPEAVEEEAPPIAPGMEHIVRLALPTGRSESPELDATTPVTITLSVGGEEVVFTANFTLREPEETLRTYIVPMMEWPGGTPGVEAAVSAFQRHRALLQTEPAYGFDLGHAATWTPALRVYPELREGLREAAGLGRIAVSAGYAPIDERFVGGEMLVRNLAHGMGTAAALENAPVQQVYINAPAMAPQSVQLLVHAGLKGLVSNLGYPGMHALAWQQAPGGQRLLHRRKVPAEMPLATADIRDMATVQTREIRDLDLPADVLPLPAIEGAPPPFYGEAAAALGKAYPPMPFGGAGARAFFEEIQTAASSDARIPETARVFMGARPGALVSLPWLTQTLARLENELLLVESAATLAALFGAEYPSAALDHAWRTLLAGATPGRIGVMRDAPAVHDALAALHEAAVVIGGVRALALDYAARKADTLTAAPTGLDQVRPFLVFNATARPRTDVVSLRLSYETDHAIGFVDDRGRRVPHFAEDHREAGGRAMNARVRFVAQDVPAYGYRIFYLTPRGSVPAPARRDDRQIETSGLRVIADPATGAIAELTSKTTGENLAGRGLNQVMLLSEDPGRTQGGHELWTTGQVQTASGIRESRLHVTETMQELVIVSNFAGGTLTRRMTLYEGVNRVDCELALEGVSLDGRLLAVTFAPPAEGRAPVFGERFGAIVGRRGKTTHVYQTQGIDNPGGSAHHPAHGWFAGSPGDHLRVGLEAALPLAPAAIIHGDAPVLAGAAQALLSALTGRGIPADLWPDAPDDGDFVWSDATRFPNYNDDLPHATGMRIAVGGPEHNAFTRGLWGLLDEAQIEALTGRFREAGAAVIMDTRVPEGHAPVPTLVLAGPEPERAAEAARACARDLATLGHYAVPPAAWIGTPPPARAASGLAVLLDGPGLCAMERDGSMTLLLAHGNDPEGAPRPETLTFRYALVPFAESWREAAIPAAAQAFMRPLAATGTDLHTGPQPGTLGLVETSDPQFVITAVKPAGYPAAALRGAPAAPRDGLALRGYESTGRPWQGSFKFFAPVRQAYTAGLLEERDRVIDAAGTLAAAEVAGFNLGNFWVMPASRYAQGAPEALTPPLESRPPMPGRQGGDGGGVLPLDGRRFSLVVRGKLDTSDSTLEVALGNHSPDATAEGIVYFTTPEGWRMSPGQIYYHLAPGESLVAPVVVLRSGAAAGDGGIVAWTDQFGATHRDVLLEQGAAVETSVERTANQVRVNVRNRSGIPVAGHVEIVASPHWWPELQGDAAITIAPARTLLTIAPYEQQTAVFRMPEAAAAEGAVVKAVANGTMNYHAVP